MSLYINGYSAITHNGIISSAKDNMNFAEEESPLTLGRKAVYSKLHTGFGKLSPADKLAFSAASLILDTDNFTIDSSAGISLGTTVGSLSTDMRYMESVAEGYPSPSYFQATLPSSPVAEVAIMFKLKGPDRAFSSVKGAGIEAFSGAERLIKSGKAENVLLLFINGIDPKDLNSSFKNDLYYSKPFAFGLLISKEPLEASFKIDYKSEYSIKKKQQDEDEESYFLKLIEALSLKENFKGTCYCNGITIDIKIEKEN